MKTLYAILFGIAMSIGTAFAQAPVDINKASAEEIADALNGVGTSKAEAIVQYRDEHGAFRHADELVKVRGIGLATVEKNREYIVVESAGE